jgi:hypothetical protein
VSGDYDQIESFFDNLQTELNSLKVLEYQIKQIPELEMALAEVLASVLVLCGICSQYMHKKRIGKSLCNKLRLVRFPHPAPVPWIQLSPPPWSLRRLCAQE